jgi:hypothetical protein
VATTSKAEAAKMQNHQVAHRRQVHRRLEEGEKHRPERPRPDLDRQGRAPANGGNCYNCHQISKEEISYGTIGPSLYNYGKNRGVTDVNAGRRKPIVQYTWGKLWNAQGLQRLLQHAALRPHGHPQREADRATRDGAAARPEVAGQPVSARSPSPRSPVKPGFFCPKHKQSLIA